MKKYNNEAAEFWKHFSRIYEPKSDSHVPSIAEKARLYLCFFVASGSHHSCAGSVSCSTTADRSWNATRRRGGRFPMTWQSSAETSSKFLKHHQKGNDG